MFSTDRMTLKAPCVKASEHRSLIELGVSECQGCRTQHMFKTVPLVNLCPTALPHFNYDVFNMGSTPIYDQNSVVDRQSLQIPWNSSG